MLFELWEEGSAEGLSSSFSVPSDSSADDCRFGVSASVVPCGRAGIGAEMTDGLSHTSEALRCLSSAMWD